MSGDKNKGEKTLSPSLIPTQQSQNTFSCQPRHYSLITIEYHKLTQGYKESKCLISEAKFTKESLPYPMSLYSPFSVSSFTFSCSCNLARGRYTCIKGICTKFRHILKYWTWIALRNLSRAPSIGLAPMAPRTN